MLSTADQELVARDPELRGLPVLLDAERLTAWLVRAGVDGELTRRYLRYKPGTSCVLAAELRTAHESLEVIVTAYAAESRAKLAKTAAHAPAGAVLAQDDELLLLTTTAAADRDLPAAALLSQEQTGRRLMRALLPEITGLRRMRLSTLSHKPQRRWVLKATRPHAPPLVVRAYRAEDVEQAASAVRALSGAGPRTPQVLAVDAACAVVVTEWLPGQPLDVLAADGPVLEQIAAAGAALAQLHQQRTASLRVQPWTEEADAVRAAAQHLALLLPYQSASAASVAERVVRHLAEEDEEPATALHGDFSIDQVIALDGGGVGLVDLDRAVLGSRAADLASAAAALVTHDVLPGRSGAPAPSLTALLDGYAGEAPLPPRSALQVRTAGALLRRAVDPFRLCAPGWAERSAALVAHAQGLLDGEHR